MQLVVESGTGRSAQIDSISVCGKTGTVKIKHLMITLFSLLLLQKKTLKLQFQYT